MLVLTQKTLENPVTKKRLMPTYVSISVMENTEDREEYFDQDLYDERYAVERTNAWMDSFRSLAKSI